MYIYIGKFINMSFSRTEKIEIKASLEAKKKKLN